MDNLKKTIKKISKDGFFSIYISTILTKVVVLFGGVLIVRFLSVDDYANYTLINNAFSILTILGDFGVSSAILLYLIENKKDEIKYGSYLRFGVKFGIISSLFSSIIILLSPVFYPYRSKIVENYSLVLFLVPFFIVCINVFSAILRANGDNNKYSIYQVINTVSHYLVIVPMCLLFGLAGSIFSQYIYYLITVVCGVIFIRKYVKKKNVDKVPLLKSEKKEFIKYSIGAQTANITNTLLYTIDIFVIGQLVTVSHDLSIYKVATIIPNALSFLPVCLMIYLLPHYVSHSKDIDWIKKNNAKLFKYGFICYAAIALVLIICSKYIFLLLYGKDYVESTHAFIILVIGFIFNSTFKVPIGNIVSAFKHPEYNTIANIACLLCNLVLNYFFINKFGYIGAAITTTLINILASIFYLVILKKVLKNREKLTRKDNSY